MCEVESVCVFLLCKGRNERSAVIEKQRNRGKLSAVLKSCCT